MCGYFKSNYYGKIFVKKINEDLVLLCNNFDSKSDSSELYNECRSLVVQTGMDPKVISYTHDNIEYLKISQHQPNQDDIYEESFEGTLVSIFSALIVVISAYSAKIFSIVAFVAYMLQANKSSAPPPDSRAM